MTYAGIEAGGTKLVCALGSGPDELLAHTQLPTTTPGQTLGRCVEFFERTAAVHGRPRAVGVGCFGPLDPDPSSPGWGRITSTPKRGWADTDVAGTLGEALGVPVGFDTDVNAAALAEGRWGAARGLSTFAYITVGTGVGGGAVVGGELLHGALHPEMGHVRVPRDASTEPDGFSGSCPYHGDCLEGLASGAAIEKRWGRPAEELEDDHRAWPLVARYLALGLANVALVLAPERMILGGGVMRREHLHDAVRGELRRVLAGYLRIPQLVDDEDGWVVAPALGDRAGVLGALVLAERAAERGR
jgi:fructokinase